MDAAGLRAELARRGLDRAEFGERTAAEVREERTLLYSRAYNSSHNSPFK